ncbi:MAG: SPOR domain-containing protein [Gammaproteobacteria bacterium]|nr:SPOR domain-containing protein [Gammaproteobacteria bacterium]
MNTEVHTHRAWWVRASPWRLWFHGLAIYLLASPAFASLRVETLQMPAWLQRQGVTEPLAPGTGLRAGDVLRTGDDARVVLRLEEGSQVKLGENARFAIQEVAVEDDQWGLFRGLLEVMSGAFRFTTGALGALRRRDVDIRVGLTAAGIHGTDIWGRSTQQQDLVCLIEGNIEISRAGERVQMDVPLSVFIAPRDGEPQPISSVDPAQLAQWAQQTEPQEGAGTLRPDGQWTLQLAASRSIKSAQNLVTRLRDAGYAAGNFAANVNGESWQRVVIVGFVSEADAHAAGAALRSRFNLPSGWVSRLP